MVSLTLGCFSTGLRQVATQLLRPLGANKLALRAADSFWLKWNGPIASGMCGLRSRGEPRGPERGFWLIVTVGGAETDSAVRTLGSGWAGSGCGDWACWDFLEILWWPPSCEAMGRI